MEYSVGDKIIFNKKYVKSKLSDNYIIEDTKGWVEPWLIGREATITRKEKALSGDLY